MISLATDSESFLTSESYGPENISVPTPLTTQNLIVVACVQASLYPPKGKGSEACATQARLSELQTEAEQANHSPWQRE